MRDLKRYAASRSIGLGKAVSDLVRRGLSVPSLTREVNGVAVFDLPRSSPRVSTPIVNELDGDQD